MKRLIIAILMVVASTAVALTPAHAECRDARGRSVKPVAVAGESGNVTMLTPTGQSLRVSGLPPFARVCSNKLFRSASKKCPNGHAKLDAKRPAKKCGGIVGSLGCWHIECDGT